MITKRGIFQAASCYHRQRTRTFRAASLEQIVEHRRGRRRTVGQGVEADNNALQGAVDLGQFLIGLRTAPRRLTFRRLSGQTTGQNHVLLRVASPKQQDARVVYHEVGDGISIAGCPRRPSHWASLPCAGSLRCLLCDGRYPVFLTILTFRAFAQVDLQRDLSAELYGLERELRRDQQTRPCSETG
jgi:hypothetical protein